MKIRLLSLTFFLCSFMALSTQAQPYSSAVGLRLGSPASVSFKTFVSDKAALEAYAGYRGYGFGNFVNVSGAYLVHNDIAEVDGLQWYYGGGAAVFFWSYDDLFFDNDFSSTSLGIQGYLGLDYVFANAPVNISLDWIPTFFVGGSLNINSFGGGYGSLAIRYVIGG